MKIQSISAFNCPHVQINSPKFNYNNTLACDTVSFSGIFESNEKRLIKKKARDFKAQVQLRKNDTQRAIYSATQGATKNAIEAKKYLQFSKAQIEEVYKLADVGFKNKFKNFIAEDGTKVMFLSSLEEQKNIPRAMVEVDKEGNITRRTSFERLQVKKIELFGEEDSQVADNIIVENTRPVAYYRDFNGQDSSEAVYEFKNDSVHKVKLDVTPYSIGRIYDYNSPSGIKSVASNVFLSKNGGYRYQQKVDYQRYGGAVPEIFEEFGEVLDGGENSGKRADLRVELKDEQTPVTIKKGYEYDGYIGESAQEKFSLSGGKLIMAAVGWEKQGSIYRAQELFEYTNEEELDSYKKSCRMNASKEQNYTFKKKMDF